MFEDDEMNTPRKDYAYAVVHEPQARPSALSAIARITKLIMVHHSAHAIKKSSERYWGIMVGSARVAGRLDCRFFAWITLQIMGHSTGRKSADLVAPPFITGFASRAIQ